MSEGDKMLFRLVAFLLGCGLGIYTIFTLPGRDTSYDCVVFGRDCQHGLQT